MLGYNSVLLIGSISDRGVETKTLETTGTTMARCRVAIADEGANGHVYRLWVEVVAYGRAREVLLTCAPGETVLLEGRLKWQRQEDKDGRKQGALIVQALGVKQLSGTDVQAQEVA